ncbi:NUDIX hydrolase [Roseibium litorale]|uniref:NUDIX domain-containing protein n=1 Tax=Roseibium litorale TaxID=2803841 RepID=A0ABR9CSJ8_9HYPH|nr:NUDIX domain-containing protein [Roseibium litorale]MBD8893574.1 NUDIX domain-containing protein [Roseibium litorale]
MTEADFLKAYDPAAFPRPSVTVDLVLMTVRGGALCSLLQQRQDHPHKGSWALPGGFVGPDEGLDAAARRVLAQKAGLPEEEAPGGWLEQLYTFGAPDRDPRMRIITVAYFALLPEDVLARAVKTGSGLQLAPLRLAEGEAIDAHLAALGPDGTPLPLAFDHEIILKTAVLRLRGKLDHSPAPFALLPKRFTLRALQDVHEAILGTPLNKPAFRRRLLDKNWLEPTGERESGTSYRPAELYRVRQQEKRSVAVQGGMTL